MVLDPQHEAESLLNEAWWGRGAPVDPIQIAHDLGITVELVGLADGISGSITYKPGFDITIQLNRWDSQNRIRFTCAHELGHFVERSRSPDNGYSFVDKRDYLSSAGIEPHEVFANQFAANLLMPEKEVRERWNRGTTPAALAIAFKVSQEALSFRLRNLGLS